MGIQEVVEAVESVSVVAADAWVAGTGWARFADAQDAPSEWDLEVARQAAEFVAEDVDQAAWAA